MCRQEEGVFSITKLFSSLMLAASSEDRFAGVPHSSTRRLAFGKSLPAAPRTLFKAVLLVRKLLLLSRRLREITKASTFVSGTDTERRYSVKCESLPLSSARVRHCSCWKDDKLVSPHTTNFFQSGAGIKALRLGDGTEEIASPKRSSCVVQCEESKDLFFVFVWRTGVLSMGVSAVGVE